MSNGARPTAKAIAVFLSGDDLGVDQRGEQITDSTFFMMLNAAADPVMLHLPAERWGKRWRVVFDTRDPDVPRLAPNSPVSAVLPETAMQERLRLTAVRERPCWDMTTTPQAASTSWKAGRWCCSSESTTSAERPC